MRISAARPRSARHSGSKHISGPSRSLCDRSRGIGAVHGYAAQSGRGQLCPARIIPGTERGYAAAMKVMSRRTVRVANPDTRNWSGWRLRIPLTVFRNPSLLFREETGLPEECQENGRRPVR